jgi:hypothetical protein
MLTIWLRQATGGGRTSLGTDRMIASATAQPTRSRRHFADTLD